VPAFTAVLVAGEDGRNLRFEGQGRNFVRGDDSNYRRFSVNTDETMKKPPPI
jgi:hypothetical protein